MKKIKVLVEANKALPGSQDGTTRYVCELLLAMQNLIERDGSRWDIDVFWEQGMYFKIANIHDFTDELGKSPAPVKVVATQGILRQLKETAKRFIKDHFPVKAIQILRHIKWIVYKVVLNHHPRLRFREYDVVHLTQPQSHLLFNNCTTKMVTTVHDLTHLRFPQFHMVDNIKNADSGMRLVINKKSEFIAVSNATKQDLLSYYPMVQQDQIRVIYEACNNDMFKPCRDPEILARIQVKYGIPETPYLLSLSTLEPRKNLPNSIEAFLLMIKEHPDLDINFVIAGKVGWMQDEFLDLAKRHGDRLVFIGFIDDDDLAAVYSGARALSYVSFYEGFGLPPLEAMSCGVPVIYGNNSSMVEVVGDGGLPADPGNINDIKEKYERMVLDEGIRSKTAKIALERAHGFTWTDTARNTLDVYEKITASRTTITGETGL